MTAADDPNSLVEAVEDILITAELTHRPSRTPDYVAENRALAALAQEIATHPGGVLQKCAELVMELCQADSAGISLLEPGENGLFRWHAAVGEFALNLGRTMPREASPCRSMMERNSMLLFREPERCFPDLVSVEPRVYESLLAPWHLKGEVVGTLWAMKHTLDGRFDAEDARLLQSLARFTSAACQMISALNEAKAGREELEQRVEERTRALANAHESLRTSEARFRTALEIETVGAIYLDMGGRIIDANEAFLAMGGYSREDVEAGHLTWQGLTPPEWMAASEQAVAELKATGRTTPYEKEYFRKDGSRWCALFAAKMLPDGTIFEFVLDTTACQQAEEALAAELKAMTRLHDLSRQVVRSADLEAMLDAILDATIELHGADFGNIQLYDEATRTLHIAAQRGFQQPFLDHFAEVDAEEGSACGMALARRERVEIADVEQEPAYASSLPAAREAGYRAVQSTPLFTLAGQPLGMLSTHFRQPHRLSERDLRLTDIYARQASDAIAAQVLTQSLQVSEERFRSLVEGWAQAVWETDSEGRVITDSPSWRAYTGQSREERLGDGWVKAIHPEDRAVAEQQWHKAVRERRPLDAEARLQQAGDGWRWTNVHAAPLLAPDGTVRKWVGMNIDITERKQTEAALRASESRAKLLLAELQHRVRNTLAVIRSIVRRTVQTSTSVEDYAMHLDGRINAFARVQTAVARDPGAGLDLTGLVADELLTYAAHEGEQVRIEGPAVRLQPKAAETLGLAVHELATNALKHGALSVPHGRIRVTWRVDNGAEMPRLVFEWKESGVADRAVKRRRQGFGTDLLERTLAYELKAQVTQAFDPDGLRCTIELPLTERIVIAPLPARTSRTELKVSNGTPET